MKTAGKQPFRRNKFLFLSNKQQADISLVFEDPGNNNFNILEANGIEYNGNTYNVTFYSQLGSYNSHFGSGTPSTNLLAPDSNTAREIVLQIRNYMNTHQPHLNNVGNIGEYVVPWAETSTNYSAWLTYDGDVSFPYTGTFFGPLPGTYNRTAVGIDGRNDAAFASVTQAVPEPSSAALLGLGLVGFLGFRRKKGK